MKQAIFQTSPVTVSSNRIIYTPSSFARPSFIHLQETGTLQATHPHKKRTKQLKFLPLLYSFIWIRAVNL